MTFEQAVRLWRLAELVRGHRLRSPKRVVSLMFQDRRHAPWDDIVETDADGALIAWQVKDLAEPLADEILRGLLEKLDAAPELRGVVGVSHPVLGRSAFSITALRQLAVTALLAGGDLSRWELRDQTEQHQLDQLAALVYGNEEDGGLRAAKVFALLGRLRVEFLGTQSDLVRRAIDGLGSVFKDPEAVASRLRELIWDDGVRGVRIDHDLLAERALAEFEERAHSRAPIRPPGPEDADLLFWTTDHRGVGQTLWLNGNGAVRARASGVIVATKDHAWRLLETRVPVPILQCGPFDEFDHDDPPTSLAAVRAAELRDLYSGAAIPLSLISAGGHWLLDAWQDVALLGGIDGLLLVRLHLWEDGGGARPIYDSSFRVLNLSRGGQSVQLWSDEQARVWEAGVGLNAVNGMRLTRSLIEPEPFRTCKLTQVSLRIDNDMNVKARLQFTADVCHADADGSWDDYSASEIVDVEELPTRLQPHARPPDTLLRYWRDHPLPGVASGWSRVPDAKERRDALWAEFGPA